MKQKKRIYISFPISGYNISERREHFDRIASQLIAADYEPVNPMAKRLPDDAPYTEHIMQDLKLLLDCDGIIRPSRWRCSEGCEIETRVADICKIPTVGIIDDDNNLNIY